MKNKKSLTFETCKHWCDTYDNLKQGRTSAFPYIKLIEIYKQQSNCDHNLNIIFKVMEAVT